MAAEPYKLAHLGYDVGDDCFVLPRHGEPRPCKVERISPTGQVTAVSEKGTYRYRFTWQGYEVGNGSFGATLPRKGEADDAVRNARIAAMSTKLRMDVASLVRTLSPLEASLDPTSFVHHLDQLRELVVAYAHRRKELEGA